MSKHRKTYIARHSQGSQRDQASASACEAASASSSHANDEGSWSDGSASPPRFQGAPTIPPPLTPTQEAIVFITREYSAVPVAAIPRIYEKRRGVPMAWSRERPECRSIKEYVKHLADTSLLLELIEEDSLVTLSRKVAEFCVLRHLSKPRTYAYSSQECHDAIRSWILKAFPPSTSVSLAVATTLATRDLEQLAPKTNVLACMWFMNEKHTQWQLCFTGDELRVALMQAEIHDCIFINHKQLHSRINHRLRNTNYAHNLQAAEWTDAWSMLKWTRSQTKTFNVFTPNNSTYFISLRESVLNVLNPKLARHIETLLRDHTHPMTLARDRLSITFCPKEEQEVGVLAATYKKFWTNQIDDHAIKNALLQCFEYASSGIVRMRLCDDAAALRSSINTLPNIKRLERYFAACYDHPIGALPGVHITVCPRGPVDLNLRTSTANVHLVRQWYLVFEHFRCVCLERSMLKTYWGNAFGKTCPYLSSDCKLITWMHNRVEYFSIVKFSGKCWVMCRHRGLKALDSPLAVQLGKLLGKAPDEEAIIARLRTLVPAGIVIHVDTLRTLYFVLYDKHIELPYLSSRRRLLNFLGKYFPWEDYEYIVMKPEDQSRPCVRRAVTHGVVIRSPDYRDSEHESDDESDDPRDYERMRKRQRTKTTRRPSPNRRRPLCSASRLLSQSHLASPTQTAGSSSDDRESSLPRPYGSFTYATLSNEGSNEDVPTTTSTQ